MCQVEARGWRNRYMIKRPHLEAISIKCQSRLQEASGFFKEKMESEGWGPTEKTKRCG